MPKRDNWVVELATDWRKAYDGDPPWKQLGQHLKAVVAAKGLAKVQEHWKHYLKETPARFASPARFAATFGSWKPERERTPAAPRTTKVVEIRENGRARMIEVPLDDPRPEL